MFHLICVTYRRNKIMGLGLPGSVCLWVWGWCTHKHPISCHGRLCPAFSASSLGKCGITLSSCHAEGCVTPLTSSIYFILLLVSLVSLPTPWENAASFHVNPILIVAVTNSSSFRHVILYIFYRLFILILPSHWR